MFGAGSSAGYNRGPAPQQAFGQRSGGPAPAAYGRGPNPFAGGPAPAPSYSSSDYVPASLNTNPRGPLAGPRGDALEAMAGGPLNSSPITRRREQREYGGLQPKAISPKVARAAHASSMRDSERNPGYGQPSGGYGQPPRGGYGQPQGGGYGQHGGASAAFGARDSRVSSNSYANGSSQNSGNVITDRSSTRVAQQPGGNSTLSLGWGAAATNVRKAAATRPPPQQQQQSTQRYQAQAPAWAQSQQPTQPYSAPSSGRYGGSSNGGSMAFGANPDRMRGSSNAFANGSSQNTGNYITERSSTRIHAPPGGRSTFTFG